MHPPRKVLVASVSERAEGPLGTAPYRELSPFLVGGGFHQQCLLAWPAGWQMWVGTLQDTLMAEPEPPTHRVVLSAPVVGPLSPQPKPGRLSAPRFLRTTLALSYAIFCQLLSFSKFLLPCVGAMFAFSGSVALTLSPQQGSGCVWLVGSS